MNSAPLEKRLTRKDVANHLGCSVSSVIRYEKSDLLKSHRAGPRLIRFWPKDVIAFEKSKQLPQRSLNHKPKGYLASKARHESRASKQKEHPKS